MLNKNPCTLSHLQTVQSLSDWDNLPDVIGWWSWNIHGREVWNSSKSYRCKILSMGPNLLWATFFQYFWQFKEKYLKLWPRHSQAKFALRLYTSHNPWLESLPGCQASTCGQVQALGPTPWPKTVEVRNWCEELKPFQREVTPFQCEVAVTHKMA